MVVWIHRINNIPVYSKDRQRLGHRTRKNPSRATTQMVFDALVFRSNSMAVLLLINIARWLEPVSVEMGISGIHGRIALLNKVNKRDFA
jgi:hypothetical protein